MKLFQPKQSAVCLAEPELAEAPQIVPPVDELANLQAEISRDQGVVADLEEQAREAGSRLAEISQVASVWKVRLSEGSADATAELDQLDREARTLQHIHSGLTQRIQSLQVALAPKVSHAAALAAQRDEQRQNEIVSTLCAKAEQTAEQVLLHWKFACSLGFDLVTMLKSDNSLDPEHRHQLTAFLHNKLGAKFFAASLTPTNERWESLGSDILHALKIEARRPRGEIVKAS